MVIPTKKEIESRGLIDNRVVSVVDKAANKQKFIREFKSQTKENDMNNDELVAAMVDEKDDKTFKKELKSLGVTAKEMPLYLALKKLIKVDGMDMEKAMKVLGIEESKEDNTELETTKKALETAEAKIKELEKPADLTPEQKALENADPELMKIIKKEQKEKGEMLERIQKMEDETLTKEIKSMVKNDLSSIPNPDGVIEKTLKDLGDNRDAMMGVLKSINELMITKKVFKEIGTSGDGEMNTAAEKLDKIAKKMSLESKGELSFEQAYSQLIETEAGEELLEESRKEVL